VLEKLFAENSRLKTELVELRVENTELRKLHDSLTLRLSRLERQLFGQKAERVPASDTQLPLMEVLKALGRLPEVEADVGTTSTAQNASRNPVKTKKVTPHGRRKLSEEDLPVEQIVVEPPERNLPGGELLQKIGEELSQHIDYRPSSLVRVEVVRPKYMRPEDIGTCAASAPKIVDETASGDKAAPLVEVLVAEAPQLPVPKSIAGPGLLAIVLVQKYADHLPLHRQERIFRRQGFKLARSTLGDFVAGAVKLLALIVEAMWKQSRETAPVILTDGTGVLILEKEKCRRGHFYVFIDVGRHVIFRYLVDNNGPAVAAELAGFAGVLQSDASSVYHELHRREPAIIEAGCWAHGRRGLFDALATDRQRALVGIGFIGKLYEAHRTSLSALGVVDGPKRKALAQPVLDDLQQWARQERQLVEKGTAIEVALGYLERQWVPLTRFLDDARLRLDNNPSELELRHEVVGRRNWLFCATDNGALWNATVVSLIASCRMHDIEPWAYLRDILILLPVWSQTRVIELAPAHWSATLGRPETQCLLAEHRLLGRDLHHQHGTAAAPAST
jgi:transposase